MVVALPASSVPTTSLERTWAWGLSLRSPNRSSSQRGQPALRGRWVGCVLQASTQNARNNPGHRKGDRLLGPRRATCQVTPSAGTPFALCPAHLWRPSTAPWPPGEPLKTACWAHQGLLTPRAPAGSRHLRLLPPQLRTLGLLRCVGSLDPLQAFSRPCWTLRAHCTWGIRLWFGEVFTPKDLVFSGVTLGWLGIRQTWNPLPLRPRIKGQWALGGQG